MRQPPLRHGLLRPAVPGARLHRHAAGDHGCVRPGCEGGWGRGLRDVWVNEAPAAGCAWPGTAPGPHSLPTLCLWPHLHLVCRPRQPAGWAPAGQQRGTPEVQNHRGKWGPQFEPSPCCAVRTTCAASRGAPCCAGPLAAYPCCGHPCLTPSPINFPAPPPPPSKSAGSGGEAGAHLRGRVPEG